jgi:hypothetical protein
VHITNLANKIHSNKEYEVYKSPALRLKQIFAAAAYTSTQPLYKLYDVELTNFWNNRHAMKFFPLIPLSHRFIAEQSFVMNEGI